MKKNFKSISIKYYILVPLIVILAFQVAILAGALIFSGVHDSVSEGLYRVLENTVSAKSESLEEQLSTLVNMNDFYTEITNIVSESADVVGMSITDFMADDDNHNLVMDDAFSVILSYLDKSGASSCYMILENSQKNSNKEAIYLRRSLTDNAITAEAGDLMLLNKYSITPSLLWSSTLNTKNDCTFYDATFSGGNLYQDVYALDLGYFGKPVRIHSTDELCVTYSVPLLDEDHNSYGIIGFDITFDYIKHMISSQDLVLDSYSSYYLGITTDYETIESICVADDSYYASLKTGSLMTISPRNETYKLYDINAEGLYTNTSACIYPLRLYTTRSPYYGEQWVLAGLLNTGSLYASSAKLNAVMSVALVLSLILSLFGMIIISRFVMKPILTLSRGVPKLAPGYTKLPQTHITEFDSLSSAIENQNISIYNLGNRMSEIIDIAGINLGVCEISPDLEYVYCTHKVFDILGISDGGWEHNRINQNLLIHKLKTLENKFEQSHENPNVYKFRPDFGEPKWLEVKRKNTSDTALIVITDITQSVLEKEKIIHDRDYDVLTGLYNRSAFIREMKYMIDEKHCKNGILSIWDLDNLKFTNDTYGHETGDKYICTLSDLLKQELPATSISARLAGDEFTIFLYDEPTEEMIDRLKNIHTLLMKKRLALPDGDVLNMSASAGYAIYDTDAGNYAELLKYADFAMYQIKKSSKGSIKSFSRDSYIKDYILVQGVGELDRIIADEAIQYAYQPIISVSTGKIFAYEALIRPISDLLGKPDNLLRVSMAQSKLDKIERITWFHALEGFFSQVRDNDNARIFINSIPNQLISDDDWTQLERLYGNKLSRIVMEITEETKSELEMDEKKRAFCSKWNIPVALDDYGSGYSNSDILVSRIFHFVKLDMSLIHNIDKIPSTQYLVKSIIDYCHDNFLRVIAEGIENEDEFETVRKLGADFVQGFLFAKPSLTLYNHEYENDENGQP